jgi:hypothetical protein
MTDRVRRRVAPARAAAVAALLLSASAAAAAEGVMWSGSAYVDYWGTIEDVDPRPPRSFSIDASIKMGVDVTDDVSFSAKACVSCHGIDMEHLYVEFAPKPWFNLQAGRLAIPFGEYSQRVDPSGHKTATAPLIYDMGRMAYGGRSAMNLAIIPQPYVDTGVLLYGTKWLGDRIQTWYGLYAVSGFRGSNDVDWMAMRSIYYVDNNDEPSVGGRFVMTYSGEPGDVIGDLSVGVSGTAGRYDKGQTLEYYLWGADASVRLGPLTLRAEYATRRTDLNPDASGYPYVLVDDWFNKEGWYAELETPLGKWMALDLRYDELRRLGAPLPGSLPQLTPDSTIVRYTGGLFITPAQSLFVKLTYEYWDPTDFPAFQGYHVGIGGAF